jgi:serine protease
MRALCVIIATACFISVSASASLPQSSIEIRLSGKNYRVQLQTTLRGTRIQFENGAYATVESAVIVGFKDGRLNQLNSKYEVEMIPGIHAAKIKTASPEEALTLAQELSANVEYKYAHADLVYPIESRSHIDPTAEPLFREQWNLSSDTKAHIGVINAWDKTLGAESTTIAVLDLGFEQSHEDLKDSWFINNGEIPGNRRDDDRNGLVDDVSGWNFSTQSANLIYGQNPKHGTATAGILAARVNGNGIAGICPKCRALPIVVSGRASEDAAAILYAKHMGSSVLSNSWGYHLDPPVTDVVSDALHHVASSGREGRGVPIIFAMHNAAVDDCRTSFPDISAHPDVIAVSSVDANDLKITQSGFGKCLSFVAPSSASTSGGIVTTDRAGAAGYNTNGLDNLEDLSYHNGFWGTSAAAPQVSGLFALLLSAEPELSRSEAITRMKSAAKKVHPELALYDPLTGHSTTYGYGRIYAPEF